MNRSYFGGFLVNPAPTKVALVTILFHCLAAQGKKEQLNYSDQRKIVHPILSNVYELLTEDGRHWLLI